MSGWGTEGAQRHTTYHVMVIDSGPICCKFSCLHPARPAPPKHQSIGRIVAIGGLHNSVKQREQAKKQYTVTGKPKIASSFWSHEIAKTVSSNFCGIYIDQLPEGLGRGLGNNIIAWSFLDIGIAPTPSPPLAIISQKSGNQNPLM